MRVGILGGGQLARMLCLAGYNLGLKFKVVDPGPAEPCQGIAEIANCSYDNDAVINKFFADCDVVTYEFENISAQDLKKLNASLQPSLAALEISQDRLAEKSLLTNLGIPCTPFLSVDSPEVLAEAQKNRPELFPGILKTRRGGYDGKGQRVVLLQDDAAAVFNSFTTSELILEKKLPFSSECSVLMVRSHSGEKSCYPLTHNEHKDGILYASLAPAPTLDDSMFAQVQQYVSNLADHFGYVGVLSLEMFVVGGKLFANEFAPRVHNSGHWTMDAAVTSQFENHLRAICGMPLGSCKARGFGAMINLVGNVADYPSLLKDSKAKLHLYGKSPKANRKLGHVNLYGKSLVGVLKIMASYGVALKNLSER